MTHITIANRKIGPGHPAWMVAELSGNHLQSYANAERLIHAAQDAGADSVKVQCFDPNRMTLNIDAPPFRMESGPWKGYRLYSLYAATYMPWDWMPKLKKLAESLGLAFFASVFDRESVDFCEALGVPAYKIASFELTDTNLIRAVARLGKPMILSTGMATFDEIVEAVGALGETPFALLKCVSGYPAPPSEMNLRSLQGINFSRFGTVGLSDHTLGIAVPVAAVALGACIIEKHLCLDRSAGGPDSAFSLEPHEFKQMVEAVRTAEAALGEVRYGPTESERENLKYRRSLWVVADVKAGEVFTSDNVRSIRPAGGLEPRYYDNVLGKRAKVDIARGTPLMWDCIEGNVKGGRG